MPDPQLKFDKEELTLTISNLGGGWTFGQLGELSLFDTATVQFPSSWSAFKIGVATQVIQSQWRLNARLSFSQTLEAGVQYTSKDGVGSSLQLDNELLLHLLDRPTQQIDFTAGIKLDGKYENGAYEGSSFIGIGLRGKF